MKIAVLISSYNGGKFIKEQIESILDQKCSDEINIIVRDDGSSDSTIELLNQYKTVGKLRWYKGENLGPALSFLDLLKNCSDYDYYAFCDQDDVWSSEKVDRALCLIKEKKADNQPVLYCSNAELVDYSLNSLGRKVYRTEPKLDFYTLCCAGGLLGCTMVFNDTLAKLVTGYPLPPKGKIVMHDFYLALLCAVTDGIIIFDNESSMLKYRQHDLNTVGVNYGIINTIKSRIKDVFTPENVSIAQQADYILEQYGNSIDTDKKSWLSIIRCYKDSLKNRVYLAFSKKTSFINFNMSLRLRLAILLGNR